MSLSDRPELDGHLRRVAEVCRRAFSDGTSRGVALQDEMGMSYATALRWLKEAAGRGYLTADEAGHESSRPAPPAASIGLIWKRDGTRNCALCREPVDYKLPRGDPMCWTFDHIIPASEGGTSAPENLRIAHKRCNEARGNGKPHAPAAGSRVTSASGGCIGCDGPDPGRGGAAVCRGCWGMLPPSLQAPLKVPPWNGNQDHRARYGAAVSEAAAYLRAASADPAAS